jgi:hypothetical protein
LAGAAGIIGLTRPPAPMPPSPASPPRIASLVPSLTELVVGLGLGDHLVARTGFCIHPRAALQGVPKVGGTKDVNLARLEALRPTHVLVNIDENRLDTVDALRAWGAAAPEIIVTHPCTPHDNLALVAQLRERFGHLPGVDERAAALLQALAQELAETAAAAGPARRVLYLVWRAPWISVARDTYIAGMLSMVNWQTWPDARGGVSGAARYPVVRGDEPWLAEVEQVLLSSEPFAFGPAHLAEARTLCPNALVRLVDGEMLSWYGPRALAGLRYLRTLADGEALP